MELKVEDLIMMIGQQAIQIKVLELQLAQLQQAQQPKEPVE